MNTHLPHLNEKQKALAHIGFEIGLICKAIFAFFETLSGLFVLLISNERIEALTAFIKYEQEQDPEDLLLNYALKFMEKFTLDFQEFTAVYLISHGLVKLVVLALLWRKKLWAYPLYMLVLGAFIVYQIMNFAKSPWLMIGLTVFDIAMIWLTFEEYIRCREAEKEANHAGE